MLIYPASLLWNFCFVLYSKDLVVGLPCFVAHPASLPPGFWTQEIMSDPIFNDVLPQPTPWAPPPSVQPNYIPAPSHQPYHRPASVASFHPHYPLLPPPHPAPVPYQAPFYAPAPTSPTYGPSPPQQAWAPQQDGYAAVSLVHPDATWLARSPSVIGFAQPHVQSFAPPPRPPTSASFQHLPPPPPMHPVYQSPPQSPSSYAFASPQQAQEFVSHAPPPRQPVFAAPQLTPANSQSDRISHHLRETSMQRGRSVSPARTAQIEPSWNPVDSNILRHHAQPDFYLPVAPSVQGYRSTPSSPVSSGPPTIHTPHPPGFVPFVEQPSQPLPSILPSTTCSSGVLSPKAVALPINAYFDPIDEESQAAGTIKSVANLERLAENYSPELESRELVAESAGREQDKRQSQTIEPVKLTMLAERTKKQTQSSSSPPVPVSSPPKAAKTKIEHATTIPSPPVAVASMSSLQLPTPSKAEVYMNQPDSPPITPAPSKPPSPKSQPILLGSLGLSPPSLRPPKTSTKTSASVPPPTAEETDKLRRALAEAERLKQVKASRVGRWLGASPTEDKLARSRSRSRDRRIEESISRTASPSVAEEHKAPSHAQPAPPLTTKVNEPVQSSRVETLVPLTAALSLPTLSSSTPKPASPPPVPSRCQHEVPKPSKPASPARAPKRFSFTPSNTITVPVSGALSPTRARSPALSRVGSPPPFSSSDGVSKEVALVRSGTVANVARVSLCRCRHLDY